MNMFLKKKEAFERIVKSKPVFQEIDRDRKRKKEKKKYIKWYEVCSNVTSFKGMIVVNGRFCPQSVRSFCPIVAGFNAGTYKVPACVL